MPDFFNAVASLPSALFAVGAAAFWRAKRLDSMVLRFMGALGWIGLCTLPAVLVQALTFDAGGGDQAWSQMLPIVLLGWWVLAGGSSVIAVFEASAKAISGHRQSTMLDNWPWFWALLALQCAVLIVLLWPALGRKFTWKHPRLWLTAAALLLNSLTAVSWPWWGT
jgi:hypothetical protein